MMKLEKKRFTVRRREEMKEEEVYGVRQRMEEGICRKVSEQLIAHS